MILQTCPVMSRLSILSRLVLNHKMTKYSKIWANGRKKVSDNDNKVIPWIALSKSSDQKVCAIQPEKSLHSLPLSIVTWRNWKLSKKCEFFQLLNRRYFWNYGVPSKSPKSFICGGVRQTINLMSPGKGAPPSTPSWGLQWHPLFWMQY